MYLKVQSHLKNTDCVQKNKKNNNPRSSLAVAEKNYWKIQFNRTHQYVQFYQSAYQQEMTVY